MSEIVITLVNQCDDEHDAQVLVYQTRPPGATGGEDEAGPAWIEVEVPAGSSRDVTVPDGPRYFVGVEDAGPGGLHPGRRDTIEVRATQKVVVSGSLVSGLRVTLG